MEGGLPAHLSEHGSSGGRGLGEREHHPVSLPSVRDPQSDPTSDEVALCSLQTEGGDPDSSLI